MRSFPALLLALSLLTPIAFGDGSGVAPVSKSNAPVEEDKTTEREPTCGDPVGMITGNAYETAEDLRVECPEVDLVMFRAYSSGSAHEGRWGTAGRTPTSGARSVRATRWSSASKKIR